MVPGIYTIYIVYQVGIDIYIYNINRVDSIHKVQQYVINTKLNKYIKINVCLSSSCKTWCVSIYPARRPQPAPRDVPVCLLIFTTKSKTTTTHNSTTTNFKSSQSTIINTTSSTTTESNYINKTVLLLCILYDVPGMCVRKKWHAPHTQTGYYIYHPKFSYNEARTQHTAHTAQQHAYIYMLHSRASSSSASKQQATGTAQRQSHNKAVARMHVPRTTYYNNTTNSDK